LEGRALLEMYLFINPLGGACYETEKHILKLVNQSKDKINFRFIPLLSLNTISLIIQRKGIALNDLETRNLVAAKIYRFALDYKAALFQGKKRGRNFLLAVQKQVLTQNKSYCDELVYQIAQECELDLEMFKQDRCSEFTIQSFKQDQEMAAEMNVTTHPTLVLYNLAGCDYAIALADYESLSFLEDILSGKIPPKDFIKYQKNPPFINGQTSMSQSFCKYPVFMKINK
jgi:predicted DsbA family dithiol-disulfide isomerase